MHPMCASLGDSDPFFLGEFLGSYRDFPRGFRSAWQVKFWVQKVIGIASIGKVEIPAAVFTQIMWIASGGELCCFYKKT